MKSVVANRASDTADLVGQVADEFLKAVEAGEQPEVEEYAARYPEVAAILRDVLPALTLMNPAHSLGESNGHAIEDLADKTLGDFRLIREIGRGGMGVVYEAEQISLGRTVALKILPFAAMLDPRQLARFRNESRAAASLHHTNIVPVFAVGCERSVHFYAMQYIAGESLARVIEHLRGPEAGDKPAVSEVEPKSDVSYSRDIHVALTGDNAPTTGWSRDATPDGTSSPSQATGRIPKPLVPSPQPPSTVAHALLSTARSTSTKAYYRNIAELGIQAAEALDYAHEQGVIHRDIKPANLILDETNRLWITDFGLARLESDAGMTMTGDLIGTLRYMSPEQALAKRVVVDHRTDIYSLGVTLYELLALRSAFAGNDRQKLLKQIAFDDPPELRKLNRQIPIELETIVQKAIRKNPTERYATARDLAEDLRSFLESKPIKAKPPTRREKLVKWSARHPAVLLSTTIVAAMFVVVLSIAVVLINGAKNEAIVAHESERQSRERADQQSELALKTLNLVVTDIQSKLAEIPAARDVRRSLLNTAVDGLKAVARTLATATKADRALMESHLELGETFSMTGGSTNGSDTEDAREQFERARDIALRLAQDDPKNTLAQRDLYRSWYLVAEANEKLGNYPAALDAMQKSFEINNRLAQDDPHNAKDAHNLAASYFGLGTVYGRMGNLSAALSNFEKSIEIFETLGQHDPESNKAQFQLNLAGIYAEVGDVKGLLGDQLGSRDALQKMLQIIQRLAENDPQSAETQTGLRFAYQKLGERDMTLGKMLTARDAFQKALGIAQKLAEKDPHNAQTQRDVAQTYERLATACAKLGDLLAARNAYQKAFELRTANDDPNFRLAQRDLAFAYGNLGDVKLRLNNPAAARDAYDGMLKILSRLAKVESKRAQIDLADCYGRLGHLEEATEDFPAAVHLFEHGLAILEQLNNEGTTIADLPDNRASLLLQTQAAAVCTAAPQAIASLEFALAQPKEILPELLGIRSRALARRGKAQEAAASADKLASLELADGRDFLHAAVGFALCAEGVQPAKPDAKPSPLEERYATRAVELLKQAQVKGYFKDPGQRAALFEDPNLDPLRLRDDFQKLVASVNPNTQPSKTDP